MAGENAKSMIPFPRAAAGIDSGSDHPCAGCLHFYGAYKDNRCCNYILDTGKKRPCPPGEGCTVKHPITCKEDLRLRKGTQLY